MNTNKLIKEEIRFLKDLIKDGTYKKIENRWK